MIDISRIRKYTNSHEDYAINWFNNNGFDGEVVHQWVSETAFRVEKDGVGDTFRLTAAQQSPDKCDIKRYMEDFGKSFRMKVEIVNLKRQLAKGR